MDVSGNGRVKEYVTSGSWGRQKANERLRYLRLPTKTGCNIPLETLKPIIGKRCGISGSAPIRYGNCIMQLTA